MKPLAFQMIDDAKPKRPRLARLKRDVRGKVVHFKAGMIVMATHWRGSSYTLERRRWITPKLPICNQLAFVPRTAFEFIDAAPEPRARKPIRV